MRMSANISSGVTNQSIVPEQPTALTLTPTPVSLVPTATSNGSKPNYRDALLTAMSRGINLPEFPKDYRSPPYEGDRGNPSGGPGEDDCFDVNGVPYDID